MVRYKNRFVVVELNLEKCGEQNISQHAIYEAIISKIQQLHGDFGVAAVRSGLVLKYCNPKLHIALIRARHGPHRILMSTLPFIERVHFRKVVINTLYVGATMRNCFKFLKQYHVEKMYSDLKKLKGTRQYNNVYKEYLDFIKCNVLTENMYKM